MRVTLFTKDDCKLCEDVKAELRALQVEIPHELIEVDIESDPILRSHYAEIIPVVKVGPYELEAPIDATQLRVTLGAARDGWEDNQLPPAKSQERAINLHKILLFFSKRWLAIVNLLVFLYVGLPFSAPVLIKAGATRPASVIYALYNPMCHQLAFRSWFLFGEQAAYPVEIAGTGLTPYGEATGFEEDDFWGARDFIGTERLGYKVALCQRDVAIYGGILLGGLLFTLIRGRLKPISLALWLLIGVFPIALDGGSQLLSNLPFLSFPIRESTPLLRTVTGLLFGIMNVWLAFPYVEESMREMRVMVTSKLAGAGVDI